MLMDLSKPPVNADPTEKHRTALPPNLLQTATFYAAHNAAPGIAPPTYDVDASPEAARTGR